MQGVEPNVHEKLPLLELVLRLEGDFRRHLELIRSRCAAVEVAEAGQVSYP